MKEVIINARFLTQKVTGVQRFAVEICLQLKNILPGVIFVSPYNILDHETARQLEVVVIGRNTGTIWEQIELRKYLSEHKKPLLVNFCNTGIVFYKRQIVTIHDMSYKVNPAWFSKKFYYWYNFLIPNIANNSLKVLTVSISSKNDIVNFLDLPSSKIEVIYNAVMLSAQKKAEHENVVPEKYLLTVSSLEPRKNLNTLLEAVKQIRSNIPLIIVGLKNSNFGNGLNETLINTNIIIKGYVSDDELAHLFTGAQALVYVSFYEGFGLPPLEAMALGCPVIVSDIPAHKEICGNAALYANPYNAEDITNKIDDLIMDNGLRNKLIAAGSVNVKRFNWKNSAFKVSTIINECV